MSRQQQRKYPKTLTEIAVEVTKMMKDRGSPESEAMAFGFEVAEVIRRRWGGTQVYIPRGSDFFLSKRDEEILEEFNGTNGKELCRKHGITTRRLYQIRNAARIKAKRAGHDQVRNSNEQGAMDDH